MINNNFSILFLISLIVYLVFLIIKKREMFFSENKCIDFVSSYSYNKNKEIYELKPECKDIIDSYSGKDKIYYLNFRYNIENKNLDFDDIKRQIKDIMSNTFSIINRINDIIITGGLNITVLIPINNINDKIFRTFNNFDKKN